MSEWPERKVGRLAMWDYAAAGYYFVTVCTHGRLHLFGDGERAGSKPARSVSISEVMRQFKTFSARKINATRGTPGIPVWQRSYYDHIIRDEADYHRVWQYIDTNPAKWAEDEYYGETEGTR